MTGQMSKRDCRNQGYYYRKMVYLLVYTSKIHSGGVGQRKKYRYFKYM